MTQKQKKRLQSSGKISRFQNKTKIKNNHQYLALLNKAIALLCIVGAFYYIASINNISIKGFVLKELKTELSILEQEKEALEQKAMELESYEHISRRADELKMVKVDKIDYITVTDPAVAIK
jgi:cell division protein FtsB